MARRRRSLIGAGAAHDLSVSNQYESPIPVVDVQHLVSPRRVHEEVRPAAAGHVSVAFFITLAKHTSSVALIYCTQRYVMAHIIYSQLLNLARPPWLNRAAGLWPHDRSCLS